MAQTAPISSTADKLIELIPETQPPTIDEIRVYIAIMKNNTAPGNDRIKV